MSNTKPTHKHPARAPTKAELDVVEDAVGDLPRLMAKLRHPDVAESVSMSDDALFGLIVILEVALVRARSLRDKTHSRST